MWLNITVLRAIRLPGLVLAILIWALSSAGPPAFATQPNGTNDQPSLSGNGRYLAFQSAASNLVSGDTNGHPDIFVRDLASGGVTTRVSVSSLGLQSNGPSVNPSISDDGRYVAFQSAASNLAPDTGPTDIFVHDRTTGSTTRISGSAWNSFTPEISGSGNAVTFVGRIGVGCDNGCTRYNDHVYHYSISTKTLTWVSTASTTDINGNSSSPSISKDGRYVAFASTANNLVAGDTNGVADIFRRDVVGKTTRRVSLTYAGGQANGASLNPSITGDGLRVAYQSAATNLDRNYADTNGGTDIIHKNLSSGVSVNLTLYFNGNNYDPSVSDTDQIAFVSTQTNSQSDPPDTNGEPDVFEADANPVGGTGCCLRMSYNYEQYQQANGPSRAPTISVDGKWAGFSSDASNLMPVADTNGVADVILHVFKFDRSHCTQLIRVVTDDPGGNPPKPDADNWRDYYYDPEQNRWFQCQVVGYDSAGKPIYEWVPVSGPFG